MILTVRISPSSEQSFNWFWPLWHLQFSRKSTVWFDLLFTVKGRRYWHTCFAGSEPCAALLWTFRVLLRALENAAVMSERAIQVGRQMQSHNLGVVRGALVQCLRQVQVYNFWLSVGASCSLSVADVNCRLRGASSFNRRKWWLPRRVHCGFSAATSSLPFNTNGRDVPHHWRCHFFATISRRNGRNATTFVLHWWRLTLGRPRYSCRDKGAVFSPKQEKT